MGLGDEEILMLTVPSAQKPGVKFENAWVPVRDPRSGLE